MRSGGRRVHPGSLGSLGCALGVVGFIRGTLVHSDARWWSFGSYDVAGFIGLCPGRLRVHTGLLGSSG